MNSDLQNPDCPYIDIGKKRLCKTCQREIDPRGWDKHWEWCSVKAEEYRYGLTQQRIEIEVTYGCKWCPKHFSSKNYKSRYKAKQARNGHQVNCKKNPKAKEINKKRSESHKGRKLSNKTIKAISEGMKAYWAKITERSKRIWYHRIQTTTKTEESKDLFFDEDF